MMPLTELDMKILRVVSRYYVLTREQVQQLCCESHAIGRGTRKRLGRLREASYIVKHRVPVCLPDTNGAAPVYYCTRKGAEALANYFGDDAFLATNTKHPRADRLAHWVSINNTRQLVERAVAQHPNLKLIRWITEWETCNKLDAKSDQFCLHTQFSDKPPLSCSPDAGFLLELKGRRKIYYLEQDLGTSSPRQIAARKTKGYAMLATTGKQRKHFPDATIDKFRILFVTTNKYRSKKTMEEMQDKPGRELWLMLDRNDLQPEDLFTASVALDHEGETGPLLNLPQ